MNTAASSDDTIYYVSILKNKNGVVLYDHVRKKPEHPNRREIRVIVVFSNENFLFQNEKPTPKRYNTRNITVGQPVKDKLI